MVQCQLLGGKELLTAPHRKALLERDRDRDQRLALDIEPRKTPSLRGDVILVRDLNESGTPRELVMTAADCAHRVGDIFGTDLTSVCGVIHVTAVWRESLKSFITIKINNTSLHSETDFFLLNLTRARADAIITSGKILREEPEVTHDLQGPVGVPEALGSWRVERLGKTSPPLSVVLTSGRELDFAHPLFQAPTSPLATGVV